MVVLLSITPLLIKVSVLSPPNDALRHDGVADVG